MISRKLFSILLMIIIIFVGFSNKLTKAIAIKSFSVELSSRVIEEEIKLTLYVSPEKIVNQGDQLFFVLPPGSSYIARKTSPPPSGTSTRFKKADMIQQEDGSILFRFSARNSIDPLANHNQITKIILPLSWKTQNSEGNWFYYQFYNPSKPGFYTYKIATQAEPNFIESQSVKIIPKEIPRLIVDIKPATASSIGNYQFQFTSEDTLFVHLLIKITFPPGTTLTPPLPTENLELQKRLAEIGTAIRFCDYPDIPYRGLPIVYFEPDGSLVITFNSWKQFGPTEDLEKLIGLTISEKAGITNPRQPGNYVYKIMTQSNRYRTIESQPFIITEK